MKYLIPDATKNFEGKLTEGTYGHFINAMSPHKKSITLGFGVDNGCFSKAFSPERFIKYTAKLLNTPSSNLLFVVVPDKVGDAVETTSLFHTWKDKLKGLPLAYVLQDGIDKDMLPDVEWYFIGGSTEFKLGSVARDITKYLVSIGKSVHMGRVNSPKRVRIAKEFGCVTVDGTRVAHDKNFYQNFENHFVPILKD